MSFSSPCLRVSVVKNRRGQTLILALAILFLFVLLGSIFITMVIRNLQRTTRQTETDDAVTLALAGLQHAAQQFRTSAEGADWRPRSSEALWRTPSAPPGTVTLPGGGPTLDYDQVRAMDPDAEWLSATVQVNEPLANGSANTVPIPHPFVRVPTGRGRFLLRITYLPRFVPASGGASGANNYPDEFDESSAMIHIESIGRPGEFDPNDPSFLREPEDPAAAQSTSRRGQFHRVEAFVPVGLVDQLWWITNFTGERGPANLGVPPYTSGDGRLMEAPSLFYGGIRSDVDLLWHGRNEVRLYPGRGDAITIKGVLRTTRRSNYPDAKKGEAQLRVEALASYGGAQATKPAFPPATTPVIPSDVADNPFNPTDDRMLLSIPIPSGEASNTRPYSDNIHPNSVLLTQGGVPRYPIRDEGHLRLNSLQFERSARLQGPPLLNQADAATGVNRWLQLTRDSGGIVEVQGNTATSSRRAVNAGAYGLTDLTVPAPIRAKGLYLDNYEDIQSPGDRRRMRSVWQNPLDAKAAQYGWAGSHFIPQAGASESTKHEIAEVELTTVPDGSGSKPVIRITRWDPDVRQMNAFVVGAPTSGTGRERVFYDLGAVSVTGGKYSGTLGSPRRTREFDLPENGIFYAEGSIRVRGTFGVNGVAPRGLNLISGGTIYIEGNILKANPGWHVGLFAQDYVTLNPTAFTRVSPGTGVDYNPNSSRWELDTNHENIEFSVASAEDLPGAVLHLKHSGAGGAEVPITTVALHQPTFAGTPTTPADRYDFGSNKPLLDPPPPPPGSQYSGASALFYVFRPYSPDLAFDAVRQLAKNWHESFRYGTAEGVPNYERKSFFLPAIASDSPDPWPRGVQARFRLDAIPNDEAAPPGGGGDPIEGKDRPYWLSRAAFTGLDRPLQIRVEASIYAFTGSWFIIPPPYFNDEMQDDTRQNYALTGLRQQGTLPMNQPLYNGSPAKINTNHVTNAQAYPFYGEPLNVDVQIVGTITENMTAEPHEVAEWTRRLWTMDLQADGTPNDSADNDPTYWPPTDPVNPTPAGGGAGAWSGVRSPYSPRLTYRYDWNLKRMVRARIQSGPNAGYEEVVSVDGGVPGITKLSDFIAAAGDSYVETLPVLPRLPASSIVYAGNPL